MLIEQLINTKIKNKKVDVPRANIFATYDNNNKDIIGNGAFAYVKNGTTPFEVRKKSYQYTRLTNDGYFVYITTIMKNKLFESNPYFPRIYSINTVQDKNSKMQRYSVNMEKLQTIRSASPESIFAIHDKIFGEDSASTQSIYRIYNLLNTKLRSMIYNINSYKIYDEQCMEALQLIYNLRTEYDFDNDLHINNMMIRKTSIGDQLVITDPLS